MWRRFKILGFLCATFGLAMAIGARAEAAPITGGIVFGGVVNPGTDFTSTNSIDILGNDVVDVTCASGGLCSGSYAPVTGDVHANYSDFTFQPLPGGGYAPLWSFAFGGLNYSFDLLSISSIVRTGSGIVLHGSGLAHITGFDDTLANWSFSADRTGVFGFSSTVASVAAPEPGSMLLFGTGLFGLATVVRRRLSRKSG